MADFEIAETTLGGRLTMSCTVHDGDYVFILNTDADGRVTSTHFMDMNANGAAQDRSLSVRIRRTRFGYGAAAETRRTGWADPHVRRAHVPRRLVGPVEMPSSENEAIAYVAKQVRDLFFRVGGHASILDQAAVRLGAGPWTY